MSLKEASYPVDARGRPDLRYYKDSLEYYIQLYEEHLGALKEIVEAILIRRAYHPPTMALLVGLSGIDGSGGPKHEQIQMKVTRVSSAGCALMGR